VQSEINFETAIARGPMAILDEHFPQDPGKGRKCGAGQQIIAQS